jgi:hypothetical protein
MELMDVGRRQVVQQVPIIVCSTDPGESVRSIEKAAIEVLEPHHFSVLEK